MSTLADATAAELELGTDVSTFPDLDPTFAPLIGPRVVAEALARRLTTPRGSLLGQPDYGIDVRDALNEGVSRASLFALKASIEAEAEADPRVAEVDVSLTFDPAAGSLRIVVAGTTAAGPFELVMAVTALTVEILTR